MAQNRKQPRLYVIYRSKNGPYEHVDIQLVLPSPYGGEDADTDLQLRWQANRTFDYWYGFRIELRGSLNGVERAVAELRRIWRGQERPGWDYRPEQAVADLEAAGWVHGAYDARLHRYVRASEWLDPALSLWGDDRDAMGHPYLMATALAKTAGEAQDTIARELARKAATDAEFAAYLTRWLRAGRPVRLLEEGRKPPAPPHDALTLEWAQAAA